MFCWTYRYFSEDNLRLPMSLMARPITRFIRTTDMRTRNRAKRSFVSQKLSGSLTIMSIKSNSPSSIVNILRIPSPMLLELKYLSVFHL